MLIGTHGRSVGHRFSELQLVEIAMFSDADESQFRQYVRRLERSPVVGATKSRLRRLRQALPGVWRLATSGRRALPDAVIVGAQKAGTTQLYATLVRHPRCFGAIVKEVQYFCYKPQRSLNWYRSHFALAHTIRKVEGVCTEATPCYLPSPQAIARMHSAMPTAKVIVLLRDPVQRAFSHYQHEKMRRRETRSFAQVVDQLLRHRPVSFASRWLDQEDPEPLYDYVGRGYYALQLEMLWRMYGRDQTLVVESDDLFADTEATAQRVFDFVGLDRYLVSPQKVYNRGHYRERIDPAVAARLREHYRSHDAMLMRLLGRPMRWMYACNRSDRAAG